MVTVHAHPGLVAVRAGEPDQDGRREFSSGLLIAPGLVLTARHTVAGQGGALPAIEVSLATGARGDVRLSEPVAGTVAWLGQGGQDAALIELADQPPEGDGQLARSGFVPSGLAWGEPVGTRPVAVILAGLPGFASVSTGDPAEVETARGTLDPDTYTASDRYAVTVAAWPAGWQDWKGISGAAVTCAEGGHLVGVVAWSDKPLAGCCLTAVPVRALLADPGFRAVVERHLGRAPEAEPVEIATLLSRPREAGTAGALLRADAGLTAFTGRETELSFLERWRDDPAVPNVRALLVTGRGGEGKTRLAIELVARARRDGWAGGVLRQSVSPEEATVAAHPGRPLLLVIDYAAARAPGIAALVRTTVRARPAVPVRLLLLARTAGQWWTDLADELADELPGLDGAVLPLGPLLTAGADTPDPAAVFAGAANALAPHLAPFTGRSVAELRDLAARLPAPELTAPRFGHVLTVQMTALAALMQAAAPAPGPGDPATPATAERVEDTLLRHEELYRDRLARQLKLDDLRPVRDRAVLAAALFGARGPTPPDARQAACSMVAAALSPDLDGQTARQRTAASWIAGLYPPGDPEPGGQTEYWGQVLPDRLGEFLTVRLLAAEQTSDTAPGLLESLVTRSDADGITRALLTLSRAIAHDERAAGWIARLVAAKPLLVAPVALLVATYAENPVPLRAALVQLGEQDPDLFREFVRDAQNALPLFSLRQLESSASLTRQVVLVVRELAGRSREDWLALLALLLVNQGMRLFSTGQRDQAVAVSAEAVSAYRELVSGDRDARLPQLAMALNNYAAFLSDVRRYAEALPVSAETVTLHSELASADREEHLPHLARALSNHAALLAAIGRHAEALPVTEEALTLRRELAAGDREAHLPDLATSVNNHANRLAAIGRRAEALPVSAEAVTLRRELVDGDRDAYLPDLARSLRNRSSLLAEAGLGAEALAVSDEALATYRELTAISRDAYLPDLAKSLLNHIVQLVAGDRVDLALSAAREAVAACRELTGVNRDAYLPDLAEALDKHALLLAEAGEHDQARAVTREAIAAYRELAAHDRDAYLPELAESLRLHAAQFAEAEYQADALLASGEEGKSLLRITPTRWGPVATGGFPARLAG